MPGTKQTEEGALQKSILRACRSLPRVIVLRTAEDLRGIEKWTRRPHGAVVWRNNTGAIKMDKRFVRFSFAGSFDLMAVRRSDGQFGGFELKSQGRKRTKEQRIVADLFRSAGAFIPDEIYTLDQFLEVFLPWIDGPTTLKREEP